MEKWRGWRKISYESELDHLFVDEIASIPGGDKLYACIQCGTCSGMCPLSPYMDYTPRQIIAMIRAGLKWASFIPKHSQGKINAALKDRGIDINLTNMKPEDLDELILNLNDLQVDVDGNEVVRVFCE